MIKIKFTILYVDNSKSCFEKIFLDYIDMEIYIKYQIQNIVLRDINEIKIVFVR